MKYKKLTPSQLNIMKTLWDKKEPMIASDFVQLEEVTFVIHVIEKEHV